MKDVELVATLSNQMDMTPQEISNTLTSLYALIGGVISNGGSVNILGIGLIEAKKKRERISVNPVNGKKYLIPPKLTPVFKPASVWKSYLKNLDENE